MVDTFEMGFGVLLVFVGVALGEDGPLNDFAVTISVGNLTNTADPFQATIVWGGDPLLVHGRLTEQDDGYRMREDDGSLLVASGTLSQVTDRIRNTLIKNGSIADAMFVIGIGIGIGIAV